MYAFTAFGAVLFITGTLMFSKSKSSGNKEAAKLIKILQRPVGVSPEVTLHRINMDLELYCALKQKREDRLIGISEKNNAITKMLKDFTESFDIQRTGIIEEDLKLIREGYSKFYKLRLENEGSADGRQIRLNTAEEKIKEAHEFLDRFDTQGADPFTEITDKLGRYTLVLHTVQKEKDACLQMKERYGLTGVLPEGIPENDISEDELV